MSRSAAAAAGVLGTGALARPARAAESATSGGLKKAVLYGMLPKDLPVPDKFKLAADVGFDGIEAYTTDNPRTVEELGAAAEKAGIRIHSVMNQAHWSNPLSSHDPEVVKRSVEGMKTSIANAKAWKADTVLLVPAVVGRRGKEPLTRYQEAYERSQKVIREQLLPVAREAGVIIAVENVWNKFLLSPLEFARYVDEFKDEHLAAYFDIGNNVQYAYPEDWILTLGKRIRKMHLKDFKRNTNQFVMLREGDVDWPAVRKAIDEIGFTGFLTAEYGGGDEAYLRDVARRIDLIFAGK
ncbi:MAG: sugar phosphate isomerase/epimerase [Phycisphaerae bacterium]|jgi:hexulose-6-phosphate isomerase